MTLSRLGLAGRLLLLGLSAALILAIVGGYVLRRNLHEVVMRSFEQRVNERADRIAARLALGRDAEPTYEDARGNDDFANIFSGWYWQVDGDGVVLRSRSLWDAGLADAASVMAQRNLRLVGPRDEPLLGIARLVRLGERNYLLRVLGPAAEVDEELDRLDRLLGITLAALIALLSLTTFIQVRLGLRPLARLRASIASIESGTSQRVGQGYGGDLDPLARELDGLLERNATVTARARGHAADLAHALKKPLALLNADSSLSADVPSKTVIEQTRTMNGLIERHLARAGSGAGERRRVEMQPLIARLVALMERLHGARGLRWTINADADLTWRGEPTDMEEILGNLLDNAGKWAQRDVAIHARIERNMVCIDIVDDGPGLTRTQIERAAKRGQRFDESVEGSGLGLAIARDIAITYAGSLTLQQRAPSGLKVQLQIPQ